MCNDFLILELINRFFEPALKFLYRFAQMVFNVHICDLLPMHIYIIIRNGNVFILTVKTRFSRYILWIIPFKNIVKRNVGKSFSDKYYELQKHFNGKSDEFFMPNNRIRITFHES